MRATDGYVVPPMMLEALTMRHSLRHLDDLSPEDSIGLENCIARFEAAWQGGERPVLDDYLTGDGPSRRAQLVELVYTDLEYRLKAGQAARVEDYLRRYPELAADRDVVLDLIAAECELRGRSSRPPTEEYHRRFPDFLSELATVPLDPKDTPADVSPVRRPTWHPNRPRAAFARDVNGLRAELFQEANFDRAIKTRIDGPIDWIWGPGAPDADLPPNHFSIRWTGWLKAPRPGRYKLITRSDDGVRLWLDGRLLIDEWPGWMADC